MRRTFAIAAITLLLCFGVAAQDDHVRVDAQVLDLPIPNFPAEARATGLAGQVRVNVAIDENGNITGVRSVAGPDSVCSHVTRADVVALREEARSAALKARFMAATENGKPVASTLWVNYDFTADTAKSNEPQAEPFTVEMTTNRSAKRTGPISGGVLNGKAIELPKPPYPPAARAVRATGAVSIQVLIQEDGTVFSASPASGHPLLQSAARNAACGARFTPTLLNGEPAKVSGIITYNFVP